MRNCWHNSSPVPYQIMQALLFSWGMVYVFLEIVIVRHQIHVNDCRKNDTCTRDWQYYGHTILGKSKSCNILLLLVLQIRRVACAWTEWTNKSWVWFSAVMSELMYKWLIMRFNKHNYWEAKMILKYKHISFILTHIL